MNAPPKRIGGYLDVDGRRVRVSTLNRVLWPDELFTKAQLIDYYIAVAPVLLPHLRDRPLTLHRYPEGVYGEHFFQTRTPPHPSWVRTARMSFPRTGKSFDSVVVDDLPGLVWAANLATIEFHPFLGRTGNLDHPTALVFDLDPGPPVGLVEAAQVALRLHQIFDELALAAFVKTSGGKGLHVVVPVGELHTYDDTKALARHIARVLTSEDPGHVTDRMTRAERQGKVFVDWSQNDPGKSTVAPYSLRAMRSPTVSTPMMLDELRELVEDNRDALGFTPADALDRVERHGDLFAEVLELQQRLPSLAPADADAQPT
jgi:bifunctional non-homologous end joining protein LigD